MTRHSTASFDGRGHFRRIRLLNGDNQKNAAKRFGVSQSAVSKWELGESRVSKRHFPALRTYAIRAAERLLQPFGLHVTDR
jgi:transcriptional regulator with XRE-family HTH domain